jgi:2-oxoglutarate ferredoxin oxidoreductase subunit alpha
MGDKIDLFIPLNQDAMDRHLRLLRSGACAIYDKEKVTPGKRGGVQLCPMPMKELTKGNKLAVNTAALGAALQLIGIESEPLETVIARQFKKKATRSWPITLPSPVPATIMRRKISRRFPGKHRGSQAHGNHHRQPSHRHGRRRGGVKFYAAYPMSPSTGVLMWMAAHARELGIMVRQVEDEIGVMNMVIGAATPAAEPCARRAAAGLHS